MDPFQLITRMPNSAYISTIPFSVVGRLLESLAGDAGLVVRVAAAVESLAVLPPAIKPIHELSP